MRIVRMKASFGGLRNRELALGEGLNIIEAPNEGGKSTWSAFLRAMLYGVNTKERDRQGYIAEKNRYQPWGGGPMEGSVELIWQGRSITLRRSAKGSTPFGQFEAVYTDTQEPVRQGLFGIFEVFADTIVICTLTALVILLSGVPVSYGQAAGAELTISGFVATYGNWVTIFTAVAMCCFAFSTIIGWGLYGARCVEFLFSSRAIAPFMVVYSLVAILGATADLGLLWSIAETFNGLMSIPNLIALFLLSGTLLRLVRGALDGSRAPRGRA
mgnify:CR=1 FL=1